MIHFADNNNLQLAEDDELHKLNPLLEKLLHNYKVLYEPEEYVCVDEIFPRSSWNVAVHKTKTS